LLECLNENLSAVTKIARYVCLDDDPTQYSAANDAHSVTVKADIETANGEDMTLPEESTDPHSKTGSKLSNSTVADNPLADDDDDDDDDDRVLFNADIVCTEHGEIQTEFSILSCVMMLTFLVGVTITTFFVTHFALYISWFITFPVVLNKFSFQARLLSWFFTILSLLAVCGVAGFCEQYKFRYYLG